MGDPVWQVPGQGRCKDSFTRAGISQSALRSCAPSAFFS
jgi:hypothetical protein